MKTVERKAANEEASDEQKVTLGSHRDIFLASRIYPQYNGTAPPKIHHSDQGVQYLSGAYVGRLNESRIRISLASRGAARENGYAERLIRTLKEEEVYMRKRPHSSLGYRTPAEFEAQFR